MMRFVEHADSIQAQVVGKAIPKDAETGKVELEIAGVAVQIVSIVSTPCRYGGYQRWFLCPGCGTRIGKLYLPAGEIAFLCRRCHRLAYRAQMTREERKKSHN